MTQGEGSLATPATIVQPRQGAEPGKPMLIVCPSCSSRYELDAAKLGPTGRKVRCASCQTLWHVDPAQDFPEPPSAVETQALLNEELERANEIDAQISAVASEHTDTLEAIPPQPRKRGKGKRSPAKDARIGQPRPRHAAAFVALGLGGAALLGLLVWQRNLAVRGAPQLAIVFEKLGLPINVRGLSLSAVESGLVEDGQNRFLVVEGDVTNISKGRAPMPPIEVAVKDAAGQTLYTWTTEPPRPNLEPAELVRFRARLASPPEAGKSVLVRFTSAKATGLANAH
ncbi:zinc-ribbon domain-containing protein [Bosea vaviloviae]|uniref:Zinc finger/thioredoxin putative domain-containing protein n=1 Tax=Bosea vaviloviae TaxID=1526658 RepID=A0A1D7TWE7_9HYPH|nr:zinc-ribbon domain-containing protein [Bosea vaviloviae]AOO79444.1 hypothetical protein BHK69_02105 [Bosea vaviloviae]